MRAEDHFGPHFRFLGQVGQLEAEPLVDRGLEVGRSLSYGLGHIADLADDGGDLLPGWLSPSGAGAKLGFELEAFGFGFGDPLADLFEIAACLDGSAVTGHLGFHLGELGLDDLGFGVVAVIELVGVHCVDGLGDAVGSERLAEPAVDLGEDHVLSQIDVARVVELVADGVLAREGAAVVRGVVDPLALHLPLADPADHQPLEGVGVTGAGLLVRRGAAAAG
nr:hypothetical protein [Thermoactinospora rubra]